MRFTTLSGLLAASTLAAAQSPSLSAYTNAEIRNGHAFQNISAIASEAMQSNIQSRAKSQCTWNNADVRREWRTLPAATRKSFTDAVICLQKLEPQVMTADLAASHPGVKSRFDEYIATHINYTLHIHDTADFFAWHRGFTHFLEQDLRDLCAYTGVMPYWNWAEDADAPQNSSLFSGDAFSLGSNGKFVPGRANTWLAQQDIVYPPGTGGGCVQTGPFHDYTVNLGPLASPNTQNVASNYQHNPRCLSRDINPFFSKLYNTYQNVTELLLNSIYMEDFQDLSQGYKSATNKFGVHGGGHWQIGGSMGDFFSSPSDPIFYLHHAQVDKIWTIWQNLDIYNRQNIIRGTATLGCAAPDCPEMQLTDKIPFGFVAEDQTFGDLMDTFAGPFCYRYE
ncbi:related to tyrosinase [Ramularia collo-cygni]|uniref:Related to tyrosinase n=1 Tax=Ramularia collo-cygni TaxID=112498 RepID=A0A2D3USA2_9PEZI|nr:related to tyrosinase [Ramularia collo-cygni]CZT19101.1 related to tyrosinase [Ramularia collo-cygni]